MAVQTRVAARPRISLALVAWVVLVSVSVLPAALFYELAGEIPAWLKWGRLGLLVVLVAAAVAWPGLRPLRNFFIILLALFVAEEALAGLQASALWPAWWASGDASFAFSMGSSQLGRLLVTLVMLGILAALGYHGADYFLARGQLAAPIEPVRWLGFARPIPWTRFGGLWVFFISLGLLAFLLLGGRPSANTFVRAAPLLPVVLVLAVMNAFNEEMTYRATLLAGLAPVVGPRQAVWMAAAFFGLGHYFGVPYGVVGVLMAGFLGWLLGKAMVETRGLAWAWFIHFVQDVLIFTFMAAGSITPGG